MCTGHSSGSRGSLTYSMDGELGIPLEPSGSFPPHVAREPDTSQVSSETCIAHSPLWASGVAAVAAVADVLHVARGPDTSQV